MSRLLAVVFSDLESHSVQWTRTSNETMVKLVSQYRQLAETTASQYGCLHRNFTGDGHLFLFENPDAAIQFGLRIIRDWQSGTPHRAFPRLSLRVGCHFGECILLENDAWIGRGIALAKRVESAAGPDCLFVTENVLSIIDLPLYGFEDAGGHSLKGDHLPSRNLYRITSMRDDALETRAAQEMTAERWFLRGVGLSGNGRDGSLEEAECYRSALQLRPNYPEAHNNLGVILREAGDLAGAAEHYRQALQFRPDYPEAHYNYGLLLERTGRAGGARKHLEEALRCREDYAEAHHALANLLREKIDLPSAIHHYQEALRIRPVYPEAHNDFAVALEDGGETAKAEEHLREAIQQHPSYKEAHYNYALLLERLNRLLEARQHYEEALRLWPEYAEACNNLAVLLHVSGDLTSAADQYRRAIQLRPNDPEVHYNYALLLDETGQTTEAARHAQWARDLMPEVQQFKSTLDSPE